MWKRKRLKNNRFHIPGCRIVILLELDLSMDFGTCRQVRRLQLISEHGNIKFTTEKSFGTFSFLDTELKIETIVLICEFRENQQALVFFSTSRRL